MRRRPSGSKSSSGASDPTWWWSLRSRDDWCVLDTETTGLGAAREVVEVAVRDAAGRLAFESLVRPQEPPEPAAVRIHGLDEAALACAPGFGQVLPRLLRILEGRTLLAYNAAFDRLSLQLTAWRHGVELPRLRWGCVLERYRTLRGMSTSLRGACRTEGIPVPTTAHRAAGDTHLTWSLVQALLADPTEPQI
ncbi:MAG: exonuclease domain-containing protein [Thermoanaerobaculia bacterium]